MDSQVFEFLFKFKACQLLCVSLGCLPVKGPKGTEELLGEKKEI